MRLFSLLSLLTLGLGLLAACGTAPTAPASSTPPGQTHEAPIIRPETRPVDDASRQALQSFTVTAQTPVPAYELRYTPTPLASALKPGDVLASAPGPNAPYGYPVKVRRVRNESGVVIVAADQAQLTDAILRGHLEIQQRLKPEDELPGQSMTPGGSLRSQGNLGTHLPFTVSLDKVLYDGDDDPKTTGDQAGTKGKMDFDLGLDLLIDIGKSTDFRAKVSLNEQSDLTALIHGNGQLRQEPAGVPEVLHAAGVLYRAGPRSDRAQAGRDAGRERQGQG